MAVLTLSHEEAAAFGKEFVAKYMAGGFGAMSKREIDLLVFHLLSQTAPLREKERYEMANTLRIAEKRIDSLRRDSAMRHAPFNHAATLAQVARALFVTGAARPSLVDGKLEFPLEDAIQRRELNYAVRKVGYAIDTSFNSDVVRVEPHALVAALAGAISDVAASFVRVVNKTEKKKADVQSLLDSTKPLSERVEAFLSRHHNKIALLKDIAASAGNLAGAAVGLT